MKTGESQITMSNDEKAKGKEQSGDRKQEEFSIEYHRMLSNDWFERLDCGQQLRAAA